MSERSPGRIPGYWMAETSGVLRRAVVAYLHGEPLTDEQMDTMRAYLRQWVAAPGFIGVLVDALRRSVDEIRTREQLERWIEVAVEAGIDPL